MLSLEFFFVVFLSRMWNFSTLIFFSPERYLCNIIMFCNIFSIFYVCLIIIFRMTINLAYIIKLPQKRCFGIYLNLDSFEWEFSYRTFRLIRVLSNFLLNVLKTCKKKSAHKIVLNLIKQFFL